MRTVFLNEEARAVDTPDQIARVAVSMRLQGVATLAVYEPATSDAFALVRVPLCLFAGEGAQAPRIVAEQRQSAPLSSKPRIEERGGCSCHLVAPCSFCVSSAGD